MTIETELMALRNADGLIVVETVWEWAKANTRSELHRSLEWNKDKAAKEYQLWQIRRLVALHIRTEQGDRQAISLSIDRVRDGGGYRDLDQVLARKDLHEIMLEDALGELDRVQAKYDRLKELTPVWEARDAVRRRRRGRKGGEERPVAVAS